MKRLAVFISLAALFSLAFAAPALAAAPSNDAAGSARPISILPFTDGPYDTTGATPDASDPDCFGAGTNASVWYTFTTGADPIMLLADTAGSDYTPQIAVVTGSPTGDIAACGIGSALVFADTSTTYYFMVAACFNVSGGVAPAAVACDPAATGGSLVFSLDVAPPPPTVELTVNPTGTFNRFSGSATISGTVLCTGVALYTEIDVQLSQTVGRFKILGSGGVPGAFVCDGTAQPWSVEVIGITGKFKGGRVASVSDAYACGFSDCGFAEVDQTIKLR
jgi:hypothetical protein